MMLKNILFITLLLLITSCSAKKEQKPLAQELYQEAINNLKKGNLYSSQDNLDEIISNYPYSDFSDKSEILKAFTYYLNADYEELLSNIEAFIKLRPANKYIPYMMFLKAQSYLHLSSDFLREQNIAQKAINSFNFVKNRYKDSKYSDYSVEQINKLNNVIAHYYLNIGKIKQKKLQYLSGIRQFNIVIFNLPKNKFKAEAMFRLVESYYAMGLVAQAKFESKLLNKNYPKSKWSKYNRKLLNLENT
jgi:outer membrane protein assembly factor BamD